MNDRVMRFLTPERFTYYLPKEEQKQHDISITFINELLKDPTVHLSEEQKEAIRSQQFLRKPSEASLDEDMLFGTDSDDSFNLDYHIPKETLRKERILKRDKERLDREKERRAFKRQ